MGGDRGILWYSMTVVIRIRGTEKKLRPDGRPNRGLALLGSALVWPLGVVCFFLCAWRWVFDLRWVGLFLVTGGVFSHWQIWFTAGMVWQVLAVTLKRYGEGASDAVASPELLRKEVL